MSELKQAFHELVAQRLIAQLQEGTAPWQVPWEASDPGSYLPNNPVTGNRYKGINALHLLSRPHRDQRWMTYKQAVALGVQVIRGEKGTPIQYWKFTEDRIRQDAQGNPKLDEQGTPQRESIRLERPRVFFATVFNAEQIDGLPPPLVKPPPQWQPSERAEHILQSSGATLHHGSQHRAAYRPATDSIYLPDKNQFAHADAYYATALHELGHWTGHPSRLNRDLVHPFGSDGYAREELRAEIASMILGDELGIGHDPSQHVAYVGSWIRVLQDDPLELFRAAADAEKIQSFVLALAQVQRVGQTLPVQSSDQKILAEIVTSATVIAVNHHPCFIAYSAERSSDRINSFWPISTRNSSERTERNPMNNVSELPPNAIATDAIGQTLSDANAQSTNQTFEEQVLAHINSWKPHALDQLSLADAVHFTEVLETAYLFDTQNPFWQRNTLPDDLILLSEKFDFVYDQVSQIVTDRRVASARSELPSSLDAFHQASLEAFNTELPSDWNGSIHMQGYPSMDAVVQTSKVREATGEDASRAFGVGIGTANANVQWLAEFNNPVEAWELVDRLALIDAHSERDEFEKAVKFARIHEMQIEREPAYTSEDLAAARALRKDVEFAAIVNDSDLKRRTEETERLLSQDTQLARDNKGAITTASDRFYLSVPFEEKEEAKSLGAKWDRRATAWYVPATSDPSTFSKWSAPPVQISLASDPDLDATSARQYLAVPYDERDAAKKAGAIWDGAARSWYVGPAADLAKLTQWAPDAATPRQASALSPVDEFADALRNVGCVVSGEHPIMDGRTHRISVEGDRPADKSGAGFYVGYLDGHPAGYIKNNKTGEELRWKSLGYVFNAAEKAQLHTAAIIAQEARRIDQTRLREETANAIGQQMTQLVPVAQPTPYMLAKGVQPQAGVYTDNDGRKTYVPAVDAEGKQWTLQTISEDGTKRFPKHSRKSGCFHVVGGFDALRAAPALVIAEGFATACSVAEALGFATVAAFDAGNLVHVATALHEKYPHKPVVIAGDNDLHLEATQGVNPGRSKAEEAAAATGGKVVLPMFSPGELVANPKKTTDFNDLVSSSVFGRERLHRQLGTVVDECIRQYRSDQKSNSDVQSARKQPKHA